VDGLSCCAGADEALTGSCAAEGGEGIVPLVIRPQARPIPLRPCVCFCRIFLPQPIASLRAAGLV
jgi:hypothetical protein